MTDDLTLVANAGRPRIRTIGAKFTPPRAGAAIDNPKNVAKTSKSLILFTFEVK
ncbi:MULTISPECIES: hypothetical protein [unclassified Microcystis]|uniref:hypothetical protein n=1 Tax=unclassified Microcystis TaxID=2643300 RepID=UPI0022C7EEEB|nr:MULTISPECIES: hypothetical protein [unclassified Microcystis]MCA2693254.1 hypothetical protein [Microcystis sp. M034S2]MCA2750115.1 hypothetical protein [Microcystis sp. M144S2]MCZ8201027.1 hypothetical protein [Microcystis sp. LE19-55.1A]MCZ8308393.1 hypothetical protein [Microcystis sp. LE19-98.1E]